MEANKQAKLPAVVSATPAVVQMERAHVACYNSTCALHPALQYYVHVGIGARRDRDIYVISTSMS